MIILTISIVDDQGRISFGTEVPTTEAKADELVRNFHIMWFPGATDTGWRTRDGKIQRSLTVSKNASITFFKRQL